jgi:hypothetical protein
MRYPASEKLEIIRLVEQSRLSARRTLQKLNIPRRRANAWEKRRTGYVAVCGVVNTSEVVGDRIGDVVAHAHRSSIVARCAEVIATCIVKRCLICGALDDLTPPLFR